MRLTIKDVLNYEIMKKARIITGKDFENERYIQWISVIEMPVENFVRKNEVVLTTAIGCNNDVETLKTFVQDVIDSEASALLIATGRHIFDIPKEVIDLAEKHNFMIIELPWELRFSRIIEKVMKEINDIHYKEREKSEKVQQELLKLILKETDLNHITKFIQRLIGCSIIITDRSGSIQEISSHTQSFIKEWKSYVLQGILPLRKETYIETHDPMFQKFQMIEIKDQTILQLPVLQVLGDAQGYIFVLLPRKTSVDSYLTQYRVNVLEHSATTIALWLSRKNAVEDTKMRLRSDFVQELAKGEFVSSDQASSRAKLLGYNIKLPYVSIVGYPENLEVLFRKRKQDDDSFEHWLENMIRYIEEEIYYAAQSLKREVMMTYQGEQLLIFLEIPSKTENENATNFLDLVERRLGNLLPEVIISWGIGNYSEDFNGFAESYQHANVALNIGRRKKGTGNRMMYEKTRVDRVLLNLAQNNEMKEVIMSTIEPLVQYDNQRNMDLIETFSVYNQFQGNVSQTARSLNLHRQSLLYRLRKIESLTGLSLIDPEDLFLLDLSIKTWKLGVTEKITQQR
ncbi:PucR family transcriptional regulator [Peribacillus castrilensis]|uniref:Regulator of polyketide synthase expression n=1 Tax=Peribacillus simplex TaxID=1478 RepID=A0AAN2PL87_9BACI|nr:MULTISPECIES: PucR family transcriptional regulator [Bacillaceae]MCP1094740.1 PucR family transcriptional regulator ligand-binding domain-containing protein [Bacillaceae bacterium OS4b]MBD8588840.1 PucR family transcriptional regulator ligand-binding domain-containing protein [Peribacillus simplex]MCF7624590.1 PucR family transcriptional regulator ligand-binding domain-containing protein [Peribacillus frigoritolerans]MCP1155130.1 PucR family transcriptional regulator ligand-binding domain-co